MEFSFGTLELERTNLHHLGTAPLSSPLKGGSSDSVKENPQVQPKGLFAQYLSQAVESMNEQQNVASKMGEKLLTDPESVDVQDVTISLAKAKQSMDLAHTVISRLISGWQELSQNR